MTAPRVLPVPTPRASVSPRPVMALGAAGFAALLTAVGTAIFVLGAWICSRIWPLTQQNEEQT